MNAWIAWVGQLRGGWGELARPEGGLPFTHSSYTTLSGGGQGKYITQPPPLRVVFELGVVWGSDLPPCLANSPPPHATQPILATHCWQSIMEVT